MLGAVVAPGPYFPQAVFRLEVYFQDRMQVAEGVADAVASLEWQ